MTAPLNTFLDAEIAKLVALTFDFGAGAEVMFARVWKAPGLDVRRLLHEPRFPTALVSHGGGGYQVANNKLEEGQFQVTVIVQVERDVVGEQAETDVIELSEVMLNGDGTNPGLIRDTTNAIAVTPMPGEFASATGSFVDPSTGVMLVWKTFNFRYSYTRT